MFRDNTAMSPVIHEDESATRIASMALPPPAPRWECWMLLGIFVLFLLVNLLTASRSPTVWMDEVMLTDPVANLYFGHGFHTAAWGHQTKEQFFIYNGLAYEGVLFLWMKVFGFGPVAVRSLNYVLMVVTTWFIVKASQRSGIIVRASGRLVLACVLLCGYGAAFSYRSGRYDILGACEVAGCFFVCTLRSGIARYIFLVTLGMLMPWTGIQLLPMAFALGLVLLICLDLRVVFPLAAIAAGTLVGGLSLYFTFRALGQWKNFVAVVRGNDTSATARGSGMLNTLKVTLSHCAGPIVTHDFSVTALLIVFVLGAWVAIRSGSQRWRSPLIFGIASAIVLPFFMNFSGHYPVYYSWMTFLPVSVAAIAVWDGQLRNSRGRAIRWVSAVLVIAACLIGLPLRLAATVWQWRARDYAPVEQLVERNVRADDWVYCDFSAFYPVKPVVKQVLFEPYLAIATPEEIQHISVLMVDAATFERIHPKIGGDWVAVDRYSSGTTVKREAQSDSPLRTTYLYDLTVYRRRK